MSELKTVTFDASRECGNAECGWTGATGETVHPKHDAETLLCPRCHETTEESVAAPTPAAQSAGQEAVALTDEEILRVAQHHFRKDAITNHGSVISFCDCVRSIITEYAAPVNGGERAKPAPLFMTGWQLLDALDLVAPDRETDQDQLDCEIALQMGDETCHSGAGLYAWEASEPDEGSTFLAGERAADAQQVGGQRIDGLGRMTADDDGIVRLQFASEEAAQAFMCDYAPSVEVDALSSPAKVSGIELAVIGRNHFGNPIPKAWYAAARELITAIAAKAKGDK